jgi:hypothetical protein
MLPHRQPGLEPPWAEGAAPSSLLSDPNAKFSAENVAKATKNKKNEEGRRVGHDFYDLLIEALVDPN